jgi:hypothetical protein
MRKSKSPGSETEIRCSACLGTGFPKVKQPAQPGRKIYPPPCRWCLGKGRLSVEPAKNPNLTTSTQNRWYVSFAVTVRRRGRATKTFQTEDEAKAFALKLLAGRGVPSAGTVNPHRPKRTIAPCDIAAWARSEQ